MDDFREATAWPEREPERESKITDPPVEPGVSEDYWLVLAPPPRESSYTLVTWLGETVSVFADGSYGKWAPASQPPSVEALRELVLREALSGADGETGPVQVAVAQAIDQATAAHRELRRRREPVLRRLRRQVCPVLRRREAKEAL